MVTSDNVSDENWGSVAELGDADRDAKMFQRYQELAELEEEDRQSRMKAMATSEYALPDDKLRMTTLSRMRTLLKMEPEKAKTVISSYDVVMRSMPGNAAWRRVTLVQTLSTEFTAEEEEGLRELIPNIFAGAPRRSLAMEANPAPSGLAIDPVKKKKPFWAFWSKG
jgi:hypothetical protein